jgi:hypothetical protein
MMKPYIKKSTVIALMASAIILSALYLLISYTNNTLIQKKLKNIIQRNLTNYIQNDVEITSLKFDFRYGFIAQGINVYDTSKPGKLLLSIERSSFRGFFIPSFKQPRVLISSVKINGFSLTAERYKNNTWNLGTIFKKPPQAIEPAAVSVAIKSLIFENGEIYFKDNLAKGVFSKRITDIKGSMGLALPISFEIECNAIIDNTPADIYCRYNVQNQELEVLAGLKNLAIEEIARYYINTDTNNIHKASITAQIEAIVSPHRKALLSGNISISNLDAWLGHTNIQGNYDIHGDAQTDLNSIEDTKYTLDIDITKALLYDKRFNTFGHVDDINGKLSLDNKAWHINKLSCAMFNSQININGKIDMPHTDLKADLKIQTRLGLKELPMDAGILLEDGLASIDLDLIYKKDGSYDLHTSSDIKNLVMAYGDTLLSGDFKIKGSARGLLENLESSEYQATLYFTDAAVSGVNHLPDISMASGESYITTDSISIKKMKAVAFDIPLSLTGRINHKTKHPEVELDLDIEAVDLAKLIALVPAKISSRWEGIDIRGKGSMKIKAKGTGTTAQDYIYTGEIKLEKTSAALTHWPYTLSDIDGYIDFENNRVSWKDMQFRIDNIAYSSNGTLAGLQQPLI